MEYTLAELHMNNVVNDYSTSLDFYETGLQVYLFEMEVLMRLPLHVQRHFGVLTALVASTFHFPSRSRFAPGFTSVHCEPHATLKKRQVCCLFVVVWCYLPVGTQDG